MKLQIFSDGASRGNPGPSAAAFIVLTENGKVVHRHSEYLGVRTNNMAEYEALILALEWARESGEEVACHIDSELVLKHLNGEYRVRSPNLKVLWRKVNELRRSFRKISFRQVPRTDKRIQEVDWLANETLDKASGG